MNSVKFQNTTLIYRILLHFYTLIRIQFIIKSKRIKYLGINLMKEVKDLYSETYKTLMKEIEDNINKWKNISCLWVRRINTIKMPILPKTVYRSNAVPNQNTYDIFHRTKTNNPKICMKPKKTLNSKAVLSIKNKV